MEEMLTQWQRQVLRELQAKLRRPIDYPDLEQIVWDEETHTFTALGGPLYDEMKKCGVSL